MNKMKSFPKVRVINLHPKIRIAEKKICSAAEKVLKLLNQNKEIHLTFTSDSGIKKTNRLFHGSNQATDVLAFGEPRNWPKSDSQFLGEIVISVDRAKIYSKRFHVPVDEELMRYVVHGLLHLLGERDYSPTLKAKMFKKQEILLQKIGPISKVIK